MTSDSNQVILCSGTSQKSQKKNQFRKGQETIFFVSEIILFVTRTAYNYYFSSHDFEQIIFPNRTMKSLDEILL